MFVGLKLFAKQILQPLLIILLNTTFNFTRKFALKVNHFKGNILYQQHVRCVSLQYIWENRHHGKFVYFSDYILTS